MTIGRPQKLGQCSKLLHAACDGIVDHLNNKCNVPAAMIAGIQRPCEVMPNLVISTLKMHVKDVSFFWRFGVEYDDEDKRKKDTLSRAL